MKTSAILVLALVSSSGTLAGPVSAAAQGLPTASPENVGMSSERLEALDAAFQRLVDQNRISGAVTLVARDGKVVHVSALGDRFREARDRMETDDIFFVQSMTKAVVSTALMMLY